MTEVIIRPLVEKINDLRRSAIAELIEKRSREFEEFYTDDYKVFSELCFCLTTANSSAEMGLKVQKSLHGKLEKLSKRELSRHLKKIGYRFYNVRAGYIDKAKKWTNIKKIVSEFNDGKKAREWLVENILGFGYKEASHFLRNIGFKDIAILDRHVIRTMHEYGMIKELPKTLNKKKYLEYEDKLGEICRKTGLQQGKLDLYLWYMKTGKVLK